MAHSQDDWWGAGPYIADTGLLHSFDFSCSLASVNGPRQTWICSESLVNQNIASIQGKENGKRKQINLKTAFIDGIFTLTVFRTRLIMCGYFFKRCDNDSK